MVEIRVKLLRFLSSVAIATGCLFAMSACEITPSIVIKAPVEEVWTYMASSANAHDWSVYFDHISPLPGAADMGVGAVRRCYRRADEQGIFWDEKITDSQPNKLRVLRTYNVTGFKKQIYNEAEYDVFQRFEALPNGDTRLTLATKMLKPRSIRGIWNGLLAMGEAKRIVNYNLENIAAAVEAKHAGRPYQRVHAYEQSQRWD